MSPRQSNSIWSIVRDKFPNPEPFYHSCITGGASSYDAIVGLALHVSSRVLIVWSQNALRSAYVRAEILLATAGDKKVAAYLMPKAPKFPLSGVELLRDRDHLADLLELWKKDVRPVPLVLR